MARIVERSHFTVKEHIQWLERDADDIESALAKELADIRTDLIRIEVKQDRIIMLLGTLLVAILAAMVTVIATGAYHA